DKNIYHRSAGSAGIPKYLTGVRRVISKRPVTSTDVGFIGDRFINENAVVGYPNEWVATSNNNSSGTKWVVLGSITGNFETEALPTLTVNDVGAQNIDTTLNKLVTWSGTAWV